ncbi:MAG: lipopolysaccharide assembly protein LapA domain-containing protein [Acidimicrobiales bacterium]
MSDADNAPGGDEGPAPTSSGIGDVDHVESATHGKRRAKRDNRFRHTRTSAAWVAATVAVLCGVALVVFIAQNTRDVRIEFFSASGRIPIAVALLAAALAGAVVVLAIGVGRVMQLRLTMRRQRRSDEANDAPGITDVKGDDSPSRHA